MIIPFEVMENKYLKRKKTFSFFKTSTVIWFGKESALPGLHCPRHAMREGTPFWLSTYICGENWSGVQLCNNSMTRPSHGTDDEDEEEEEEEGRCFV